MALKVKAIEKKIKFTKDENDPGVWRYVMSLELYTPLSQAKVIKEAALRSGVSRGVMQACWDAAGEVIKAWATEGHTRTALLEPHPHPSLTPNPSPTGEGDYHGEGSSYYTLEGRRIVS